MGRKPKNPTVAVITELSGVLQPAKQAVLELISCFEVAVITELSGVLQPLQLKLAFWAGVWVAVTTELSGVLQPKILKLAFLVGVGCVAVITELSGVLQLFKG